MDNENDLKQKILIYMSQRRMCSVSNLMNGMQIALDDIMPELNSLQSDGLVRIAKGGGCSGSCGDCSSCDAESETTDFPASAIVISTHKNEEDDEYS